MQHLDEGTIHSWLDGALSAEEAARVEAHAAECPQCAAAVAEARGFIAASSRILTALDHVPRGVVPAVISVKWYNRPAWRAAAAVLVVAVGSLVVVRNSGRTPAVAATSSDTIGVTNTRATQAQIVPPLPAATPMRELQVPAVVAPSTRKAVAPSTQKAAASDGASSPNPTSETDFSGKAAVAGGLAGAPQAPARSRSDEVAVLDAAKEQAQLKVVGTPRTIGAKVRLYEVEPGDTVTFTEPLNVQLNALVAPKVSTAEPQARRSMERSAAPATATAGMMTPSPGVPPLQVEVANGVTTISWPDATTGNMLKLSGRMSVERLKKIRLRIEQERAAAAAKKKP
jgi:hypothetical protein